jgi:uncharacterized protein YecE (DUF72 family)
VEINSSFYKLPKNATVAKWSESVTGDFLFSFKLLKEITHSKGLQFNPDDIPLFLQNIAVPPDKEGCLLIQLPPKLKIEDRGRVEELLKAIRKADAGRSLAIEFRHTSWYHDEVYHLLDGYNVSMVVHDLPASATPLHITEGSMRYFRFHGLDGRYRGSYSDEVLARYAELIRACMDKGQVVYAYFNNTMGDAFGNVQTLNRLVHS